MSQLDAFKTRQKSRFSSDRVLLIGGGVSSFAAARDLADHRNILMLEASSRLFGRVSSEHIGGVTIDSGANWQHTPERGDFHNEPAVHSAEVSHDNFRHSIFINGAETDPLPFYEAHFKADRKINSNTVSGLTLEDLLTWELQSYHGAFFRNQFCDSDAGIEPEQVSADACRFEHQTNDGDVFVRGFEDVLMNMFSSTISRINMRLNCAVIEVHNRRDHVMVITADGSKYYAEHLLLSPSVGVLKSGLIKFTPELPKKFRDALDGVRMGVLEKFFCHLPPSFFINYSIQENAQIHILDQNNKPLFAVARPAGKPLLVFLTGGNHSHQLLARTETEIANYFLDALRKCYGEEVEFLDFKHTAHLKNPFTRGSYSAEKPGHPAAREFLQDPWLRMKIIGEAFHDPFAGQVPAAAKSGKIGARWVLGLNGIGHNGQIR